LRLRDLGGLVVIDFIDMRDRKHTREVEKALKDALKYDKARVTIGRISQFGLLEMSRQRIKSALAAAAYLPCPHCHGSGRIKTSESQALALLRRIHAGLAKGNIGRIEAQLPLDVAAYLLNNKREELLAIERKNDVALYIHACPDFIAGQAEVDFQRREKEKVEETQYVEANRVLLEGAEASDMEEPAEATEATAAAEPSSADKPAKKKRRSRRRKKPAAVEEPALAVEVVENIESEGTAETTGTIVTAETVETAETLEPLQIVETIEGPAVTAETVEPLDEAPMEAAAASKPESQDGKAPSRPRRRRKPATKREQPAATGGENPPPAGNETAAAMGEPPAAGSDQAAAKPPARSNRPRPRRTTKAKQPGTGSAVAETTEMPASAGESAPAESPVPATDAKKPARRGRPRKNAAAKDQQPSGQESPSESGGEGDDKADSPS
jgi:ribonuclease E